MVQEWEEEAAVTAEAERLAHRAIRMVETPLRRTQAAVERRRQRALMGEEEEMVWSQVWEAAQELHKCAEAVSGLVRHTRELRSTTTGRQGREAEREPPAVALRRGLRLHAAGWGDGGTEEGEGGQERRGGAE